MDVRYSTGKEAFKHMTTEELRKEFLIQDIFTSDEVSGVYSHIDRIVTMGAMPVSGKLDLEKNIDAMSDFGVDYFRRGGSSGSSTSAGTVRSRPTG